MWWGGLSGRCIPLKDRARCSASTTSPASRIIWKPRSTNCARGRWGLPRDLIRLALGASDQIKAMLEEAAGRGAADQGRSAEILAGGGACSVRGECPGGMLRAPATPDAPATCAALQQGGGAKWRVHFRPGPEVLLERNQSTAAAGRAAGARPAASPGGYGGRSAARARSIRSAAIWPGTWC